MFRVLGFIECAHTRVEVPAVIVELDRRIFDELPNIRERLLFQVQESDDHVGNLNPGVVDVVLHFNLFASGLKDADEGVA